MEMVEGGNISDRLSGQCTGHEIGVNLPYEGENSSVGGVVSQIRR